MFICCASHSGLLTLPLPVHLKPLINHENEIGDVVGQQHHHVLVTHLKLLLHLSKTGCFSTDSFVLPS
jgi:hypothetical protein